MKNINKTTLVIALSTLVVGLGIGWLLFGSDSQAKHDHDSQAEIENGVWTCSMHPQIRKNDPGDCPICGMDLIPVNAMESANLNPMEIKMSPTAMQLANVQTAMVKKENPIKEIKLNGKVHVNESTISTQTSHISGRIEKLLVNTTGEYVTKGQVVAFIYSPDLISAQKELFEAQKVKDTNPKLYEAVKEKLKNWKLTEKQIEAILTSGIPSENFPILADKSGIVTTKRVNLGDHVKSGESLFELADLSKIWILFDVYESDIAWVNVGDEVEYTIPSLPSATFKSKVTFVDPVINPRTRVAKARIVVANKAGLKPEMFVNGTLKSNIDKGEKTIVIPKSAVMWTGENSVVYIKSSNIQGINFMMREVKLGTSLGDHYVIREGLEEGEEIAIHGTFSIDAAAQLAGKPSMMNPTITAGSDGGAVMTGHNHGGGSTPKGNEHAGHSTTVTISKEVKEAIQPIFDSYFDLKNALVNDDFEKAIEYGNTFQNELSKVNMAIFKGEAHNVWMKHSNGAKKAIYSLVNSKDIAASRRHFVSLSDQMVMLATTFESNENTIYVQHCPMANEDNGADWLSTSKQIKNPFFGSSMLKCGEVKTTIK